MTNNEELSDEKLNSVAGGGLFVPCEYYDDSAGTGAGGEQDCCYCTYAIKVGNTVVGCGACKR